MPITQYRAGRVIAAAAILPAMLFAVSSTATSARAADTTDIVVRPTTPGRPGMPSKSALPICTKNFMSPRISKICGTTWLR